MKSVSIRKSTALAISSAPPQRPRGRAEHGSVLFGRLTGATYDTDGGQQLVAGV